LNIWQKSIVFTGVVSLVFLTACRGKSDDDGFGDSSGGFTLSITDGPIEGARSVVIPITGVEIKPVGVDVITFTLDTPFEDNLLDFQDGTSEFLLKNVDLPEGNYEYIRLLVDDANAFIELVSNKRFDLPIPPAFEDQLQMSFNAVIDDDDDIDLTIDFDLRKSVFYLGGNDYELRPSLRLVRTQESGTLRGTVAESLITDTRCNNGFGNDEGNLVYLFSGSATAIDIQSVAGDPIATAVVSQSNSSQNYSFTFGFIPPGNYTAAFTCDGTRDISDQDNLFSMDFSNPENITILQGDSNDLSFN